MASRLEQHWTRFCLHQSVFLPCLSSWIPFWDLFFVLPLDHIGTRPHICIQSVRLESIDSLYDRARSLTSNPNMPTTGRFFDFKAIKTCVKLGIFLIISIYLWSNKNTGVWKTTRVPPLDPWYWSYFPLPFVLRVCLYLFYTKVIWNLLNLLVWYALLVQVLCLGKHLNDYLASRSKPSHSGGFSNTHSRSSSVQTGSSGQTGPSTHSRTTSVQTISSEHSGRSY